MVAENEADVKGKGGSPQKGDRVRWADSFLQIGKTVDPPWYAKNLVRRGTVEHVRRCGMVVVQWDDCDETTVHGAVRLALAGEP